MKKILLLTAVSVLAIGALNVKAATEDVNGTITATILGAFDLEQDQPIQFGNLLASADSGYSVTISPTGAVTANSAYLIDGKSRTNGVYTLTGTAGSNVRLSVTPTATLSLQGGSANMGVSDITLSETEVTIGQNGSVEFTAGATLNVSANQVTGDYRGEFTITATY